MRRVPCPPGFLVDGVWQSSSRHLAEGLAAQSMADFAERHSLGV
jgi:hypothetical protein